MTSTADDNASIVVFDLDKTLTRFDTFLPFVFGYLRYVQRSRLLTLLRLMPLICVFWRWADFTWWKHQILAIVFARDTSQRIHEWGARYARDVLNNGLRVKGVACLRRHQAAGAHIVLASASVDLYVEPIARALNIPQVLATPTCFDANGHLRGLAGANCRDMEKLRRVRALDEVPIDGRGVVAYSDSHADLPLLGWAEHGVAVCPSKRLGRQVTSLGLQVAYW